VAKKRHGPTRYVCVQAALRQRRSGATIPLTLPIRKSSLTVMVTYRDDEGWGALGDPTRRSIVLQLAKRPQAVVDLAATLPISRPAVSQHLKVLKDAGLVAEHAEGTRRIYQVNEAGLSALRDQLDTFWHRALAGYENVIADSTKE
jgi:DNA-binding transcriptional ArsR family regulator